MRLLNKFYSFLKSIYLNNSKYSNNLRHTLRIFFEREVKTKHTPTLFGAVFKGSKWVDYQTFNINKLFIKSGLTYFYYILVVLLTIMMLLGRSKSEQYFGFLPFFVYLNFVLGYIPLLVGDLSSQLFIWSYILYTTFYKILLKTLNYFSLNLVMSLDSPISPSNLNIINNIKPKNHNITDFSNLGKTNNKLTTGSSILNFSKNLSTVRSYLYSSNLSPTTQNSNTLINQEKPIYSLLLTKIRPNKNKYLNNIVAKQEYSYTVGVFDNDIVNSKYTRNLTLNLHTLSKLNNIKNYPVLFDFNINNNLQISKQQRWLVRNSLLSESIINNSFLITQAKKLLGLGLLDSNFTNKTLWLPTKSANLSTVESSLYVNNLSKSIYDSKQNQYFLKQNHVHNTNFANLNFFENSRLWVFKKYFFNNQQHLNSIINQSKISLYNVPTNTHNTYVMNNFNLVTYALNLHTISNNNFTPSLNNSPVYTTQTLNTGATSTNLSLTTPTLDLLNGLNNTFVYNVTSNPKNTPNQSIYFNNIDFSLNKNTLLSSTDLLNIKFSL